ncbi:MAG: choice-of-anchor D domain-containing protein [Acidobacteria bacterium]|nr:choice-of-anchor D domain-containing protein [Acidobacteriota bacterium]
MTRGTIWMLTVTLSLTASVAEGQLSVVVRDISPDRSTNTDPDGASGGRVNGIGVDAATPGRLYAASEFGGLWRSNDNGVTWAHLDGHVPTVTWNIEVDPSSSNRLYATSFYDGRVTSRSGINVSTDAGVTWTHPASAVPPAGFCDSDTRRTEPAAFGIAVDPSNTNRVWIGTNCGLAMTTNAGVTWTFLDPTPGDTAGDVTDVIVHNGGIIDVCGDDGHLRSTNGGTTWTTAPAVPLPSGQCSLAVSPDESYVLYAVVGTSIFESDDGGQTWPGTYANPNAQGRIPFIATNQRAGNSYDLWFGDVQLHRGTCTTPAAPAQGGAQRCNASPAWAGPFTRGVGAHDDSGDIAFAPNVASDACPVLFASDGGVFRNTLGASPACHTPVWTQPTVTPHALWNYAFDGVSRPGAATEHLYFGNQDNGSFGATNGGAAAVTWTNERCCDGFDATGDAARGVTTVCCFGGGRATRLFLSGPGLTGASPEIGTYPPGNMKSFQQLDGIQPFGPTDYIVATTTGIFMTANIGAVGAGLPTWTAVGTSPPGNACGLQIATSGGTPTFFAKAGGCDGDTGGPLMRHAGAGAAGAWQTVPPPPGGGTFGVFAIDPNNPQRIIASRVGGGQPTRMFLTTDGGTVWNALPTLDTMMTGNGVFKYDTLSGPRAFARRNGYPQPTLVAFDPVDPDIVVAGATDSGVFISTNGGTRWQLVTDPFTPGVSGTPHIPRPYYAHFDHDPPAGDINLYLGTRGRGAWRLTFKKVAMPEIQVPSPPSFVPACVGTRQTATLNVCNTSLGNLVVSGVSSSNPEFVVTTPSGGFPVSVSHDFCFPIEVVFTPTAPGPRTTTFTVTSNDPNVPSLAVPASASVGQATAVTMVADSGNFGEVCPGPKGFRDLMVTIDNRGSCPLLVSNITSSSPEFQVPSVLALPLSVAPGANIEVPIRFQAASAGAKAATMTFATSDPAAPNKVVNLTATVPEPYVCSPPLFTSLESQLGPTWGTGRTGNYTVNAAGRLLKSFGPERTFGIQAEGEYLWYPGRHEGQLDATLLYRRGTWQAGLGASAKSAALGSEANPGALSEATISIDRLLSTVRFGLFGSKGLKSRDVVGALETVGPPVAGVQTVTVTESIMHSVDTLGANVQLDLVPGTWWLDANLALLNRHAPGVSNTAGAAVRVSRQFAPWLVGMLQADVNESFVGSNTVGTVTIGLRIGRWPSPADWSNPVNPLGTLVPRVHYEVFPRVRP